MKYERTLDLAAVILVFDSQGGGQGKVRGLSLPQMPQTATQMIQSPKHAPSASWASILFGTDRALWL